MGTRGFIAKQVGADEYLTIYCHLDAYPEHTGDLLLKHYNTPEMVEKLISLGDICCLKKNAEPDHSEPHDIYQQQKDVVYAYGRDGGQEESEAVIMKLDQLDDISGTIRYVYVYTQEGEWKYFVPGQAAEGFRDIQPDLEHPEMIPDREPPDLQALQTELMEKLQQSDDGPGDSIEMRIT